MDMKANWKKSIKELLNLGRIGGCVRENLKKRKFKSGPKRLAGLLEVHQPEQAGGERSRERGDHPSLAKPSELVFLRLPRHHQAFPNRVARASP